MTCHFYERERRTQRKSFYTSFSGLQQILFVALLLMYKNKKKKNRKKKRERCKTLRDNKSDFRENANDLMHLAFYNNNNNNNNNNFKN